MRADSLPRGGVVTPLLTLFDGDPLKVNFPAMDLLVHHVIANGTDCVFLLGSTGEGLWFERRPALRAEFLRGVLPVIPAGTPAVVGLYGNTEREYLDNAAQLRAAGDFAGFVVAPPYEKRYPPGPLETLLRGVLEQVERPAYLYNNPGLFAGHAVAPAWFDWLQDLDQFAGLKDSSPDFELKRAALVLAEAGKAVVSGKEGDFGKLLAEAPAAARPHVGVVPSIGNLSNLPARINAAGQAGDWPTLERLDAELNENRYSFYDTSQSAGKAQRGLKWTLRELYGHEAVGPQPVVIPEYATSLPEAFQATARAMLASWLEHEYVTKWTPGEA